MPQTGAEFFLQPHDTDRHIRPRNRLATLPEDRLAACNAIPAQASEAEKTGETLFAVGSPTGSNSPSRAQRILANSISR